MSHESKQKITRQYLILILALIAIILSVIALTRAWFSQNKGLQTMTKVEVPYLFLRGHDSDSVSIELGEIDVREKGEKRIPFQVEVNEDSSFKLQLGYTTNLPLSYKIVSVKDFNEWDTIEVNDNIVLQGTYLNKTETANIANKAKHDETYKNYASEYVQKNAEPLYWQSKLIPNGTTIHDYILIVSWEKSAENVIDKDTDMVYLTAGITGETINDETKTNQE